jgi:hypothetical protein
MSRKRRSSLMRICSYFGARLGPFVWCSCDYCSMLGFLCAQLTVGAFWVIFRTQPSAVQTRELSDSYLQNGDRRKRHFGTRSTAYSFASMCIPSPVGVAVRLSSGQDYSVRLSSQVHACYFWIRNLSQGLCHGLETDGYNSLEGIVPSRD